MNDSTLSRAIHWSQLKGQTLQTITSKSFTVVRVTDKYVTVRPENGTRNYALSIVQELEPAAAAFASARQLLKPAELVRFGVRPILVSYAWGILRAALAQGVAASGPAAAADQDFTGVWHIIDLPDLGPGYFEPEAGEPYLRVGKPNRQRLRGDYRIGFEVGTLTGRLRDFGGERVWVFEYAGDEIDSDYGCGWARLLSPTVLEGEFIEGVGRFAAKRQVFPEKRRRKLKGNNH